MGQGYYYTLSAIAQSFAAIIALNAIFVVFKLQLVQNTLENLFIEVRKLMVRDRTDESHHTPSIMIQEREVDKFSKKELFGWLVKGKIESTRLRISLIRAKRDLLRVEIKKTCQYRDAIRNWLYVTLILNSITILSSLVFLTVGSIHYSGFQYTIMVLILVFAAYTLASTINAIMITVGYSGLTFIGYTLVLSLRIFGFGKFASKLMHTRDSGL